MKLNGWFKKDNHSTILLIHYIIVNNTSIIDIKIVKNKEHITGKYLSGGEFWIDYSDREALLIFNNEFSTANSL